MSMRWAPAFIVAGAIVGFGGVLVAHAGAKAPLATGSRVVATGPAVPGSSSGAGGGARTAVGPGANYGYGTIAVRVTVVGTRIVSVSVASLSTQEPTSQQISTQAIPYLRSEVLSTQSATINAVSGATYTSQGYVQSLQAALDQLHA
jgi:uncharacterized protein with FMN-binding domain